MSIYKEASQAKLRFQTSKGVLSVEQLWDLNLTTLSNCIKNTKKVLSKDNNDDELSFLDESKTVDREMQLRFDILKDVYLVKKSERDNIAKAAKAKEHNEKIRAEIYRRKEESIQDPKLSIEDLEGMLLDE